VKTETKPTATNEEATPELVPKLRFPEFRGAEGWDATILGELSEVVRGGSPRPIDGFMTTSANGLNWLKIGDVDKEAKFVTQTAEKVRREALSKTRVVNPGDLILSNSMSFGRPYILQITTCIHDGWIAITKISKKTERDFLYYLISAPGSQSYFVDNAAGSGVQNLNADLIKALPVFFPKPTEQQKIAECLSSVDELIAAQARKLDALKTHKKGLMQQLFPREGETQPRLRFPEFQNAGEWARMSIQEMIDTRFIVGHLDGNHGELYPKGEEFSQSKEGIPYITANDFTNGIVEFSRCKRLPIERARLFKKGVAKDGDILFAHNATVGPVAKLNTTEEFVILSTTATYFRCNAKQLSNDFLQSALSSPDFVAQYSRVMSQSTRNQVPITTQRKLELNVPKPPEQQRIADCLTSLDDIIAAQTQKHEALKTHKRGLMQQLFPSPEEVEA